MKTKDATSPNDNLVCTSEFFKELTPDRNFSSLENKCKFISNWTRKTQCSVVLINSHIRSFSDLKQNNELLHCDE